MKFKFGPYLLPLLAVGMLAFSIYHVVQAHQALPKPPPPVEPPRTPFGRTVAGAGIVEAKTENFSIGSPLPGIVLEVYVPVEKVGQTVKAGEPLFLVDNRQLKAQLNYYRPARPRSRWPGPTWTCSATWRSGAEDSFRASPSPRRTTARSN
jgi:multidrug efflux pump subunit AcrA (membrane-fusion protein)